MRYLKLESGKVVQVEQEIYQEYWRHRNRQNYLQQLDNDYLNKFVTDEFIQNIHSDVNVEQVSETAHLIIALRKSLKKLSDDEKEIINELFFGDEKKSYRAAAKKFGISHQAFQKRLVKILEKLRMDMKDDL